MATTDACSSCGRGIRWAVTAAGNRMPIDPLPAPNGNIVPRTVGGKVIAHVLTSAELADWAADGHRYLSHFATCPNANAHRRGRPDPPIPPGTSDDQLAESYQPGIRGGRNE